MVVPEYQPGKYPPSVKELSQTTSQNDKYVHSISAKVRPKFDKISWDGMSSTFAKFRKVLEGHLIQVGAGYLIETRFLNMYLNLEQSISKMTSFVTTIGSQNTTSMIPFQQMGRILSSF